MQLLLSRSQKPRSYGRVKFSLWVQFDLTDEEKALIKTYQVSDASITLGNRNRDLRRAFLPAVAVTVLAYIIGAFTSFAPFSTWTQFYMVLFIIFIIAEYLIYHQIREEIKVYDIMKGRMFTCRSVLTLLEKEAMFVDMAVQFRRFLEYMKTWGGREAIPIELTGTRGTQMIEHRDEAA